MLIENGATIYPSTLVHACEAGQLEVARVLLENGAESVGDLEEGYSPLHAACEAGNREIVELLLDHGADIEAKLDGVQTPLGFACAYGHEEIGRLLLDRNAKLVLSDEDPYDYEWEQFQGYPDEDDCSTTALHIAAAVGREDIAQMLIEHDPLIINSLDAEGWTALHMAIQEGHEGVARFLIERGIPLDVDSNWRITALHFALVKGMHSVAQQLLDKGADSTIRNDDDNTALHSAAMTGAHGAVKTILSQGKVGVNTWGVKGKTPLHLAALQWSNCCSRMQKQM